jgi:hypothetical protein
MSTISWPCSSSSRGWAWPTLKWYAATPPSSARVDVRALYIYMPTHTHTHTPRTALCACCSATATTVSLAARDHIVTAAQGFAMAGDGQEKMNRLLRQLGVGMLAREWRGVERLNKTSLWSGEIAMLDVSAVWLNVRKCGGRTSTVLSFAIGYSVPLVNI